MHEDLGEQLLKAACVLHWLGKHDEADAIIKLSVFLKSAGIDTLEKLNAEEFAFKGYD